MVPDPGDLLGQAASLLERPASAVCWEIRGPPPRNPPIKTSSSGRKHKTGENERTKNPQPNTQDLRGSTFEPTSTVARGSLFTSCRKSYILQCYRHSFIAEESLIDSNSQT